MKENLKKKLLSLTLLAPFLMLASISMACGHRSTAVDLIYVHGSSDRYVSGHVFDDYTGYPIHNARVLVENDWSSTVYEGYTDWDGYFEVFVGDYEDYEDIYFRTWRIYASGYESYTADDMWYDVYDDWEIYTGEYYLYRR